MMDWKDKEVCGFALFNALDKAVLTLKDSWN
jgi:hypothetical protein